MASKLLVGISRPRRWGFENIVVLEPDVLDYYFEEYQLGGVTRSLIRSDPPSKGVSQKLPLGTEGHKKQDGLVGPLDVWLVHGLLNDMMS